MRVKIVSVNRFNNMKKKQKIIGKIIFIIFALLPFGINLLNQKTAIFEMEGESVNWLMFYVAYYGTLATVAMVYVTYQTLKQNREQLEEMKSQWKKEHSPDLDIAIINLPYRAPNETLAIEIKNFGKGVAENVKISIDREFVNNFPHSAVKEQIDKIGKKTYRILPEDTIIIPICLINKTSWNSMNIFGQKVTNKEKEKIHKFLENFIISIKCEYKGCENPIEITFTAEDKKWIRRSITSSLEDIACHLEELENLGGNIDSLSMQLSTIHSLLQDRE